ncbi:hypothetical protein Y032_0257g411 [Ancylostoma ceylanicum]|uniref:G-protein coupled receptors family 1 profile domain-containing protein n=1 Tax=Ancylostoma ceylanicum TaxID=53326 RepID=A0A016SBM2_9BILA|nr:hypothetical protein Y032_0257g411 [Ancylostoma ceylanicum]
MRAVQKRNLFQLWRNERSLPPQVMSATEYDDYDYDSEANLTDAEYEDLVRATLWPQTVEKSFVVVLMSMMVVGVIGNTLVVVVVISKRSMWSQMNIFLTNLACADLLILIFCLPPTVINDVTKTFWFSEVFCKSILFFQIKTFYYSHFLTTFGNFYADGVNRYGRIKNETVPHHPRGVVDQNLRMEKRMEDLNDIQYSL